MRAATLLHRLAGLREVEPELFPFAAKRGIS